MATDISWLSPVLGLLGVIIGASAPTVLDRGALRRLERVDAVLRNAPTRGPENSLLRAARNRLAYRVGLQILGPEFTASRDAGSVVLGFGLIYLVFGVAALVVARGRYGTFFEASVQTWEISAYGVVFTIVGMAILFIRFTARASRLKELHQEHNLTVPPEEDATSWVIGGALNRVRRRGRPRPAGGLRHQTTFGKGSRRSTAPAPGPRRIGRPTATLTSWRIGHSTMRSKHS